MKYVAPKQPILLKAMQFDGKNAYDIYTNCPSISKLQRLRFIDNDTIHFHTMLTPKHRMSQTMSVGDWIVEDDPWRVVSDEFFQEHYDVVDVGSIGILA